MNQGPGDRPASSKRWPRTIVLSAGLFALLGCALQAWRICSLSASYDQALFLQELWATAQGRPFESSLSSVLSGAVALGNGMPSTDYLHLGQHANVLTLLLSPLVALIGIWALPLAQVLLLTAAGLVLWRIAQARLPCGLAQRITLAYFLSGAVIGPALENFHDLVWLPLLGFLVVGGLLDGCRWRVLLYGGLLLLVREDSGLLLFSLGLWALVRRPQQRITGAGLMLVSFVWVLLVTGWIQPIFDSSLSDRFLQEKFGHLVEDSSGGTLSVRLAMLGRPWALLQALGIELEPQEAPQALLEEGVEDWRAAIITNSPDRPPLQAHEQGEDEKDPVYENNPAQPALRSEVDDKRIFFPLDVGGGG